MASKPLYEIPYSRGLSWAVSAFLVIMLSLLTLQSCYAGYYATVVSRSGNTTYGIAAGQSTGCYLTPSMAMSVAIGNSPNITALDATAYTWSGTDGTVGYFYYTVFSGTFGLCSASPLTAALPNFIGGVSDPAISGNSVLSGSSSGAGSSGASSADTQALTSAVNALATQVREPLI